MIPNAKYYVIYCHDREMFYQGEGKFGQKPLIFANPNTVRGKLSSEHADTRHCEIYQCYLAGWRKMDG